MIDTYLALCFIVVFITTNRYGWGLFHEPWYIVGGISISICYLLLSLVSPSSSSQFIRYSKYILLTIFLGVTVIGGLLQISLLRRSTAPEGFINDSALQIELAGKALLHGDNPYTLSYKDTPLSRWPYRDSAGNTMNPAIESFVYPPFLIYLAAIGYATFALLPGWFDIRFVYVLFYVSLIILARKQFFAADRRYLFIWAVLANPLLLSSLLEGSNDIAVLALLLWSLFAKDKSKFVFSGLLFGMAIATKQSAWFALPYYYISVPSMYRGRFLFAAAAVAGILCLPFFAWNAQAFVGSLFRFFFGSTQMSYPIAGYGVGYYLVSAGVISSIYSSYPFWIFQSFICIGMIILFRLIKQSEMPSGRMFLFYIVSVGGIWFFSRFFHDTHLAYLLSASAAAYLWDS